MHNNGYRKDDAHVDKEMFGSEYVIQLPHQCDYWVIGDADNARQMIKDLRKAIKKFERKVAKQQEKISDGPVPD